jgi:hypothetical protein
LKRRDHFNGPFFGMRAMCYAAAAEPAFLRILEYWRFAFGRVALKGVAHAHLNTTTAPVTDFFIEINMAKSHSILRGFANDGYILINSGSFYLSI